MRLELPHYEVFRQVAAGLAALVATPDPASCLEAGAVSPRGASPAASRPTSTLVDGWDYVGMITAFGDSAYNLVVPTLADSNGSGVHRTTLFVRAVTSAATSYFDSPPDSGYSVDNLPPVPPA